MFKRISMVLLLITATHTATADDSLERMEAFGEEMSRLMYEGMVAKIAADDKDVSRLKSLIPDTSWDDAMREASSCILDEYEEKIGEDGVEKMLDDMEALLPELRAGGLEALENAPDIQPAGISEEETLAVNRSCGMMDLMQENMMAGEFMSEAMRLMQGS